MWKRNAVLLLNPGRQLYREKGESLLIWIANYIRGRAAWIHQTLFLGIVYTGFGLLTALFVQRVVDIFIPAKDLSRVIFAGIFLFLLLLVRALTGFFRQRFLIELSRSVSLNIHEDFSNHVFRVPRQFFETRKTGDIISRIHDCARIQQVILTVASTTIIDGMFIAGAMLLMVHMAPRLAALAVVVITLYAVVLLIKSGKLKSGHHAVMQQRAQVEAFYIDALRGADTVMAFNSAAAFIKRIQALWQESEKKGAALRLTHAHLSLSAEMTGAILTVIFLVSGTYQVLDAQLLLGKMLASYSLLAQVLPAVGRLVNFNISAQGAVVAAQRLRDILSVRIEKNPGRMPFVLKDKIQLVDAEWCRPGCGPLLQRINLDLCRGKMTGLTGSSGSGKTTLVRILERKYNLSKGQLLVDGLAVDRIDLFEYRESVGIVPQIIKVFNATMLENIVLGRYLSNIEEARTRIERLGLGCFLERFEHGLLTLLGEETRQLSGGEKQVIALLRSLYNLPDVLIIDEGLSSLDSQLETRVFDVLKRYSKDNIVLVITHHRRMLSRMDEIYRLEDGRITFAGAVEQWISRTGKMGTGGYQDGVATLQ
jgi:ATP-binding cassette subfamily B protein